ncbi:MAG: flagellar basal body-associated FliL family protein [Sphingomonadales bacterium]
MSADGNALDDDFNDEDLATGLEPRKFGGKKLVLFVIVPVLLLAVLGGVVFSLMSGSGSETETAGDEQSTEPTRILFYELPEMLVNLNTGGRQASYLKVSVALEVDRESAMTDLDAKMPRVVDDFQIYLRELRLEDLDGSAGMFRLKEELLRRVNTSVHPTRVKDVLFREMLVQ